MERVLASATFRSAERSRRVLEFVVRETLEGRADRLKDYTLGAEALGRGEQFDPRTDPIARVEASRLRSRLDLYYATEGAADEVRIGLPRGGYVPVFEVAPVTDDGAKPAPTPRSLTPTRALVWVAVSVASFLIGASVTSLLTRRPDPPQMHVEMSTPPTTDPASFAIAPDGQVMVFVAGGGDGASSLWLQRLDNGARRRLAGTDFASLPFWAPDGSAVGFFAAGQIRSVNLQTGVVQTLASALVPSGATWSLDGVLLYSIVPDSPLLRVNIGDGATEPATLLTPRQAGHQGPMFLPDGRRFLFYATGERPDVRGIYLGELGSTAIRRLLDADTPAAFVPPNQLLYVHQSKLFAHEFDVDQAVLVGEPLVVADSVAAQPGTGLPAVSVASNGTVAYRTGDASPVRQFVWFDREGLEVTRVGAAEPRGPALGSTSPDGRRLLVQRSVAGNTNIWTVDLDRGVWSPVTSDPLPDIAPVWSPDGDRIAFSFLADGVFDLFERAADGGVTPLLRTSQNKQITDWSRDGRYLLYRTVSIVLQAVDMDVWALPTDGDGTPFPVVQTPFVERDAQFSPDGQWVVYQSNESGRSEIYVQPFGHQGDRQLISPGGGVHARWGPDARELFYLTLDGMLMAVPMDGTAGGLSLTPGTPVELFKLPVGAVEGIAQPGYLVSADGQRFLVDTLIEQQPAPISLILNWHR